jgi:sortase A
MSARRYLWLPLLALGVALLGQGLYIPAKAALAQLLLDSAWERTLEGGRQVRPWGWADTWPVARLRQERLGVDQIVLAGASGRVLAFGPGHVDGSANPGEPGNVVFSGHRDTHFRWLADLRMGDGLQLQLSDGTVERYRVSRSAVHHQGEGYLLDPHGRDGLRLITCYPFDALAAGGELRYVVDASLAPAAVAM